MNRQNVKKRQYVKPDIETVVMESEGSLLTTSGNIGGYSNGKVYSTRGKTTSAGIEGFSNGKTYSARP